jgi:hypothetical protein
LNVVVLATSFGCYSFLSQLDTGKSVARDDTRGGLGTTPLKPKEGLNGAPSGFVAGAVSCVTKSTVLEIKYVILPGWARFPRNGDGAWSSQPFFGLSGVLRTMP